jgi:hypothetical protein
MAEIRSDHIWLWFVLAWLGYWAGARLALRRFRPQPAD